MKLENPIYESDPYLADFKPDLDRRHEKMAKTISSIEGKKMAQFLKWGASSRCIETTTTGRMYPTLSWTLISDQHRKFEKIIEILRIRGH